MKRSISVVIGLILLVGLTLVMVNSTRGATNETQSVYLPLITNSLSPIIPDTTNILSEGTTQQLTAVSEDSSIFTFSHETPELSKIAVGEVIVGEPTALAPYGFLRKVTNISNPNGQVILTTIQATLEESIQQGEVHLHHKLSPEDIQDSFLASGTSLIQKPQQSAATFNYQIDDVVLYDDDDNLNTVDDQIVANGDITLEIDVDFDLQVESWNLEELQFIATVVETSNLTVESIIDESLIDVKITLAQYQLAPIIVQVGPFPVTVHPQLTIFLGADGSVHAGMSAGVTQEATLMAGLLYVNENWQSVNDFDNSFNYTAPSVTAELNMKAYAGAQVDLFLMGVKGPYAKAKLYLQLEANPLESPWWELYAGLDVPVGVKVEVFSHTLADYETSVIDYRFLLAQSDTNDVMTTWVKAYQDNANHDALGSGAIIVPTSDGGYIIASSIYPIEQPSSGNISVLKLSTDGSVTWRYEYGTNTTDNVTAIQERPDGGYILLGTAESNAKIWLLKLNADGSIVWQKTYAHYTYNRASSLTLASGGGYVISGYTYNELGAKSDAWVLKLNSNGSIAWQKLYGGTLADYFSQIKGTTDGGYLAIGSTESFAPGAEYQPALWVLKLNSVGEISWQKTYGNDTNNYVRTTHGESSSHVDGVQIEVLAEGGHLISSGNRLLKLSDDGTVVWSKLYQGPSWATVSENADGSFLLVGSLPSAAYPPSDDMWVAKAESSGEIIWQKSIGESEARSYGASSGQSDGETYIAAGSRSYGPGDYELLVFKLNEVGEVPDCDLCSDGSVTVENISFTTFVSNATSINTTTVPENSSIARQSVFTEVVTICGE